MTFTLKPDEFKEYVDFIIDNYPPRIGIEFNYIEDDACPLRIYENGISILATEDYMCVKKNPRYTDSKTFGYFEVLDKSLSKRFFEIIEEDHKEKYYVHIDRDIFKSLTQVPITDE